MGADAVTRAGYISDRSCPSHPAHGEALGMRDGGYYCPHHDHDFPAITKNFWHEDEFETAKSLTLAQPATSNVKIKIEKPNRRVATRKRR